jgi:hypothetical protein
MLYGGTVKQILLLFAVAIAIFVIFSILIQCGDESGNLTENLWQLYYNFSDSNQQDVIGSEFGWRRFVMAIATFLGTLIFGGMLISTLSNMLERRVELYKNGLTHYDMENHIVVIGSSPNAIGTVKRLLDIEKNKLIAILSLSDIDDLRRSLNAQLGDKALKRIVLNYGSRDSIEDLTDICISTASKVYVFGENCEDDEKEQIHDSLNIECVKLIAKLRKDHSDLLPCIVAFDYLATYHIYQYADLEDDVRNTIKFIPYNFNELWARKMLVGVRCESNNGVKQVQTPLDYRPITNQMSDDYVHLIIIGLSRIGEAIAMEAARICHYPNYQRKKTKITIIDSNMHVEMDSFKQKCGELFNLCRWEYIDIFNSSNNTVGGIVKKYHHLITDKKDADFIDIEWKFINGYDANQTVREYIENSVCDEHAITTVAICLNETHKALQSAMSLPNAVYEKAIPVLVNQRQSDSMIQALKFGARYANLWAIGILSEDLEDQLTTLIAYGKRINYVYSYYHSNGKSPDCIDDNAASELWEDVRISKRWSNVYSAASIWTKLRCLTGTAQTIPNATTIEHHIETLARMEHNRWMVEELLLGYRPVTEQEDRSIDKDRQLKSIKKQQFIHYDIRPYEGLKTDEFGNDVRENDKLIVRNIPNIVSPISGNL